MIGEIAALAEIDILVARVNARAPRRRANEVVRAPLGFFGEMDRHGVGPRLGREHRLIAGGDVVLDLRRFGAHGRDPVRLVAAHHLDRMELRVAAGADVRDERGRGRGDLDDELERRVGLGVARRDVAHAFCPGRRGERHHDHDLHHENPSPAPPPTPP